MKLSKNKTRKVSDLTEPTLRVIKTKLINDNWPIARICLEFNLSVDSFLDEFIYYIKESNNKALNGKTTPYYDDEKYHRWRKKDDMCLWYNEFGNSLTIKEYAENLQKNKKHIS